MSGFEPLTTCFQGTDSGQTELHPEVKSTQRESNPHFRHGKAVRCRYIMGACGKIELSKNEQESIDSPSEIAGTRTLTRPVKSRGCCL